MKLLEEIGFYTLLNSRAEESCINSPVWRNEIIITSICNFNCSYCRGISIDGKNKHMKFSEIKRIIDICAEERIRNVRFSGGEPTLHPEIKEIIRYTKEKCTDIKHIAISTNGYSPLSLYIELVGIGVNDYSVSLDACCSSIGDMMAGGIKGSWQVVVDNIKTLSKITYVTVGIVFDKQNSNDMRETIEFAHNLGVADIRIISASQWNDFSIFENLKLDKYVLNAHPILKYRINNFVHGRNVRGITRDDYNRCGLIIDDIVIKGKYHYPCVIKMREGCLPIGEVRDGKTLRQTRFEYFEKHNCFDDKICRKNCIDVCVDYNNMFEKINLYAGGNTKWIKLKY